MTPLRLILLTALAMLAFANEVNEKIKSIIVDIWYHNYVVSTTYQKILKKLFDETIYDFTIKFPNGKFINCLKVVIQKILWSVDWRWPFVLIFIG